MARPRIALYGAGGAPYNHAAVFARAGYEIDSVLVGPVAKCHSVDGAAGRAVLTVP